MKVLETICSADFAGTEMHLLLLSSGLKKQGIDVLVACPSKGPLVDRLLAAGIPHFGIRMRSSFDPIAVFELARLIKREGVSLVHSHLGRSISLGTAAARLCGIPAVYTLHHTRPSHARVHNPFRRALYRQGASWINRTADRIIAVSEAAKATAIDRERIPTQKIDVIQNGVTLETFEANRQEVAEAKAKMGLGQNWVVVSTVAQLRQEKGLRFLVEASKQVAAQPSRVKFLVVGDGPCKLELCDQVKRGNLEEVVSFLGHREDVPAILAATDIFVLPTLGEGMPIALLEAMAAGKPVVSTRVGGPDEVVVDGNTGLLVDAEDASALANAILSLMANPDQAELMGKAGRERVKKHFSAEVMVRRTLEVYRSLAPAHGTGRG